MANAVLIGHKDSIDINNRDKQTKELLFVEDTSMCVISLLSLRRGAMAAHLIHWFPHFTSRLGPSIVNLPVKMLKDNC